MTLKTRVKIIIDFESDYSMTDEEAEDRALKHIREELSPFTMKELYGIFKIAYEIQVSRG